MARGGDRKISKGPKKVASTKKNQPVRRSFAREIAPAKEQKSPLKGANTFQRSALGRGLSVLLSPSAVSVRPRPAPEFIEPTAEEPKVELGLSIPEFEEAQREEGRYVEEDEPTELLGQPDDDAADEDEIEVGDDSSAPQTTITLAPLEGVEGAVTYVPIDRVAPAPNQPRKHFAKEDLDSLAQSIRSTGILQPLVVRKRDGAAALEIVAGERRWRAARLAGLDRVPVIQRNLTDREALGAAIIENVQRADLNAIEEAESYQRLIDEFHETQESVAEAVGKDRVTVANAVRLLKLPEAVKTLIFKGQLSAGHGRALLALPDSAQQTAIAEEAVRESMSVRALERRCSGEAGARVKKRKQVTASGTPSPDVLAIEERLRRALGTKVSLTLGANEKGEIRIAFYSVAELDRLLDQLAV